MALSPLQELMRRVSALESRRGPEVVLAQVTGASSTQAQGGTSEYYRRWRFDVRMLDQDFQPTGGEIEDVTALLPNVAADGTLSGRTELNDPLRSQGGPLDHRHEPGDLRAVSVPLSVGDLVILVRARIGTGGFWAIVGRLDPGTVEAIRA